MDLVPEVQEDNVFRPNHEDGHRPTRVYGGGLETSAQNGLRCQPYPSAFPVIFAQSPDFKLSLGPICYDQKNIVTMETL